MLLVAAVAATIEAILILSWHVARCSCCYVGIRCQQQQLMATCLQLSYDILNYAYMHNIVTKLYVLMILIKN